LVLTLVPSGRIVILGTCDRVGAEEYLNPTLSFT